MPTTFYPKEVLGAQPAEGEILWNSFISNEDRYLLNKRWRTEKPLKHIANPATGALINKTQALIMLDFNIPSNITPVGIEVTLNSQRNGRISDEIIQLWYQGELIGENNFKYLTDYNGNLRIENRAVYGGPTDLWGAELTSEIISDPSFGIMVKFQSHPYFPHQDVMIIDSISLTIYE